MMSRRRALSEDETTLLEEADREDATEVEWARSGEEDDDTVVSEAPGLEVTAVERPGLEPGDEDDSTITDVDEREPSDVVDLDTLIRG